MQKTRNLNRREKKQQNKRFRKYEIQTVEINLLIQMVHRTY